MQAQSASTSWTYPARGFRGLGRVDGRTLKCLTAEVQILCHAGYDLDADDLQDLETFGRPWKTRSGGESPLA